MRLVKNTPFDVCARTPVTLSLLSIPKRRRLTRNFIYSLAACTLTTGAAQGSEFCNDFTDAAEELDPIYLDIADPLAERVAQPLEADLLRGQIAQTSPAPLQKIYCSIGMFEMRLRFVQPAEDDAVKAIVTEATYAWDAEQNPAGWVLSSMRRQVACARGDAIFADLCP